MSAPEKNIPAYPTSHEAEDFGDTAANEDFLDDVLNITEDDVEETNEKDDEKGSETDSGSYWSAIDEDEEEEIMYSEEPLHSYDADEVHTAVLKEYDSVNQQEAALVMLDDRGPEQNQNILRRNTSQRHGSKLQCIHEDATFENFHSSIAEHLKEKTKSPEFSVKHADTIDYGMSEEDREQKIEKCIDAYDVIDQFDVKISERDEYKATQSFGITRLNSLAAGIRKTLSFRKHRATSNNLDVDDSHNNLTRRNKSSTWPMDPDLAKESKEISYSTRKAENGEIIEVISVSPDVIGRSPRSNRGQYCEEDHSKSETFDQTDAAMGVRADDVDIGNADDLHGPVKLTQYKKLHDEIDIISLTGLDDNERNAFGINTDVAQNMATGNHHDNNVFDDTHPVRPPRNKKSLQKQNQPTKSVSETDISKEKNVDGSQGDVKRSASGGLSVATRSVSKSEENIFKGMLPFLEFEGKKKSLSKSNDKNIPPNKEELRLFTDAFPPIILEFPQDRRSLIALEVYTTERTYVRGLELLVKLFKAKALQLGQIDNKEADIIFSNVHEILDFNKDILDDLHRRIVDWSDEQLIGDIFVDNAAKFKMYATFCQNYDASETFVKQKTKKRKDFEAFLKSCYGNPSCQLGLTLPSYLITPVQRTPRYILLLKDLHRKTPVTHPDHKNLTEALQEMEKIASFINDQLKLSQSEKALAALQQQIIGLKAYYFSGRTLVHEGPVCLMNIKRTYQCVLFNDLLVFAVKGDSKQSEVELVLDLSVVWFQDLEDLDPQTTKQDAIGLYTPDRPYTIYVGSQGEKKLWLQHMRSAIIAHTLGSEASVDDDLVKRSATHTYKNSCVYSGEFLESKRHGEGTMMWPNQMTYRGQWFDDERNGKGVLEYGSGDVYDGDWKNDRQDGYGVCKYSNGDIFTGEWKIGIRHGEATIDFGNGDHFKGCFKNDRIEGEGTLICKNGYEYSGTWKRNMKHGSGKLRMQNGDIYSGEFKHDVFHGKGELNYSNGSVYRGNFEEGQRHGLGTYSENNGIMYEGNWERDRKEGIGKLISVNGDVYEGTFKDNKRHGDGTMIYKAGGIYNGHWENDWINGDGVMEYKNGDKFDGKWRLGQRHGQGKMKFCDGIMYEGEWQDDYYHGRGTLERPGGWTYKGDWIRGKCHGKGTLIDSENEYKFQGSWLNGKREGKGIEMIRNSLFDGEFKNDQRDGRGSETSPDTTTYEGNWRIGQKHGKGIRKLLNGMKQPQVWHMGCLMECPVVVSREIPLLKRS